MTGSRQSKALLVVAFLFSLTVVAIQSRATDQRSRAPGAGTPSNQYVGADTCKTCHEDIFNGVQRTRHWNALLKTRDGTEVHNCESCHGPGAEHVNGGGDKSKIFVFKGASPDVITERCLQCHQAKPEHANFLRSPHGTNGVSCTTCHSPHFAKERRALLIQKQPQLCYECHGEAKADFGKPFRHRVNEGLLRCTDCHSPHGTFLPQAVRANVEQDTVCFKCHRHLQGPFVFEHVPVKTEGCVSCHQPHGSVNPRLLVLNQVNILCLRCHTPTATANTRAGEANAPGTPSAPVHNQSTKFQACTICHVFIHGSNADETFMK